ncbi:hypothetical protein HOJ01_00465 [bacterium]|jgi:prolipoprotein diacylglyceryltransferase|nr:hypothetical protein [bacterium]MBT6293261.1 hypothetical protein [bacterium]
MFPTIFHIGFLKISTLSVFSLGALITFFVSLIYLTKKSRLRIQFLASSYKGMILSGIIIGRLFEVIANLNFYWYEISLSSLYKSIAIWQNAEISLFGFCIGFTLYFLRQIYYKQENLRKWADIFIISTFISLSIYCIGTLFAGLNYGRVTESFIGITFNNPLVKYTLPIYPTQIFASLYNIFLAGYCYNQYTKTKHKLDGYLFLQGVFLFSIFRFTESLFRGDDTFTIWILRYPTILSFIGLYLGFKALTRYEKKFIK